MRVPSGAALAFADGQRRPLADPVGGEDRRTPGGRRQEGGGGVRLMMLGEEDLRARHIEMGRDDPLDPDLLPERIVHRLREGAPGSREGAERAGHDPVELQHRALVEHHRVERFGLQARLRPGTIRSPPAERRRRSCGGKTALPAPRRPEVRRRRAPPPSHDNAPICRGSSSLNTDAMRIALARRVDRHPAGRFPTCGAFREQRERREQDEIL